ncbi:hypothetical protein PR048_025932 [Dryococelus australis]|uniref:Uncharacterized protein n=1 Tax=Dryococelus australis TaxID=614101 RepID=A0ABQ9GJX4_9NEOP|nr:hypothetical protein PR048_025932 [Dryococelus australis]
MRPWDGACAGMQGRRKLGVPRENPPVSGVVQHDSHMRKSGGEPAGYQDRIARSGRRALQPLRHRGPSSTTRGQVEVVAHTIQMFEAGHANLTSSNGETGSLRGNAPAVYHRPPSPPGVSHNTTHSGPLAIEFAHRLSGASRRAAEGYENKVRYDGAEATNAGGAGRADAPLRLPIDTPLLRSFSGELAWIALSGKGSTPPANFLLHVRDRSRLKVAIHRHIHLFYNLWTLRVQAAHDKVVDRRKGKWGLISIQSSEVPACNPATCRPPPPHHPPRRSAAVERRPVSMAYSCSLRPRRLPLWRGRRARYTQRACENKPAHLIPSPPFTPPYSLCQRAHVAEIDGGAFLCRRTKPRPHPALTKKKRKRKEYHFAWRLQMPRTRGGICWKWNLTTRSRERSRENPSTSDIVRHVSKLRESGVTRPEIEPATAAPAKRRVATFRWPVAGGIERVYAPLYAHLLCGTGPPPGAGGTSLVTGRRQRTWCTLRDSRAVTHPSAHAWSGNTLSPPSSFT